MKANEFKHELQRRSIVLDACTRELFRPICQQTQCTWLETQVLELLRSDTMMSVTQLGECLHIAKSNTSALCKKMEQRKLLVRQRSEDDERIVRVMLSEVGKRLQKQVDRCFTHQFELLLEQYGERQLVRIMEGMDAMIGLLREMNKTKNGNDK